MEAVLRILQAQALRQGLNGAFRGGIGAQLGETCHSDAGAGEGYASAFVHMRQRGSGEMDGA